MEASLGGGAGAGVGKDMLKEKDGVRLYGA